MLYKRKDSPFWWFSFTVDGKVYKGSTKRLHSDKKNALRVAHLEYQKILDGVQFGVLPEYSLEAIFSRVCKTVEGKTRVSYDLSARKWMGVGFNDIWSLGPDTMFSEVTESVLHEHQHARLDEGLSTNSINIEIRFMQRAWNLAGKWSIARAKDLQFDKLKGFEKTRYLSDEEEAEVLGVLRDNGGDSANKAIQLFTFLVDTGVRLNEGLMLQWPQINMTDRKIEVFRTKTSTLSLVPISDRTYEILWRLHNQPKPFMEMSRAIKILRSVLDDVCNKDKLVVKTRGRATIHSLRDTFATRMLKRGMTLHEIAKLLGHTNTSMTRKYAHLETEAIVQKARKAMNMHQPSV